MACLPGYAEPAAGGVILAFTPAWDGPVLVGDVQSWVWKAWVRCLPMMV